MPDYTPIAPSYYARQSAAADQAALANMAALRDYWQAPDVAGAAIAALSPNQQRTPEPGQASIPVTPNTSRTEGAYDAQPSDSSGIPVQRMQPQQQSYSGSATNGYSLPDMVSRIKAAYPNASPQVILGGLQQSWGMLNQNAKQQLEMINQELKRQQLGIAEGRLGISQQNAATNAARADIAAANSGMRWANNYNPTGAPPPMPPSPGAIRGQVPPSGGVPQVPVSQLQPPAGAGSFAKGKADVAEAQSGGRQLGQLSVAEGEFNGIAPLAIKASNAVERSNWMPLGMAEKFAGEMQNDPRWVELNNYAAGLTRAYARAFGGTVSSQERAEKLLRTASSQEAFKAAVETLQKEIKYGKASAEKAISSRASNRGEVDTSDGIQVDGLPPPPSGFVVQ